MNKIRKIHQVKEASAAWLIGNWNDDLSQWDKGFIGMDGDGVLDKINDDKLARDVDDLSSLFVELEEGTTDFLLPCDDQEDVLEDADEKNNWIGDLESDAMNVDELSAVFDVLVAKQTTASPREDEEMHASENEDDEDEEEDAIAIQMVPCAPVWAVMLPLDPRSAIRTPVCKDVDSRIPRVQMPRMDLSFCRLLKPAVAAPLVKMTKQVQAHEVVKKTAYQHDPATCWICKSDKSPYKKFALHRYLEKRHRRNWKRGPRYSGRSNVATSRVRDGGRFIQTAQWI